MFIFLFNYNLYAKIYIQIIMYIIMKNYKRNNQLNILSIDNIDSEFYDNQYLEILYRNKIYIEDILSMNFFSISNIDWITYLNIDKSFFDEVKSWDYKKILVKILVSLNVNNRKIDYIKIPDNLSKDSKREIFWIIYENFPMLSINRIEHWDNLVNINFFWIKKLNDEVWKEIVDEFINCLKKYIITNFDYHNENGRLLLKSYKNLLFSYSWKDNIISEILGDIQNTKKLVDFIFKHSFNRKILNWKNINNVKEKFYENFNLWFWYNKVIDDNNFSKIVSYYISTMWSKKNYNNNESLILNQYDIRKIKTISDIIIKTKELIIENFKDEKVLIDWMQIDILIVNNWNYSINDKLISYYRKWWKNLPSDLLNMLSLYISLINENFDFFSPSNVSNSIYTKDDENNLNDLKIKTLFFEYNHKWFYNNDYFNEYVKNIPWFNCFIDVIDMWVSNINDSLKLCERINNWELKWKYIDKWILNWWSTWTKKMLYLANIIQEKYRNVKICIWWDELFLFFQLTEPSYKVLEYINLISSEVWLKTRICYWNDLEVWYEWLDELTKINKYFEKRFNQLIYYSGYNINHNDNQFELFVNPNMKDFIIKNIEFFIEEIDNNLNINLLSYILSKNITDKYVISEFSLNENEYNNIELWFFEICKKFDFTISISKISEVKKIWKYERKFKIIIW